VFVALDTPHSAVSWPFAELLLGELADRQAPVCHIPLEKHRKALATVDSTRWAKNAFPWSELDGALRQGQNDGTFSLTLPDPNRRSRQPRPYRSRGGGVVLVEGPLLLSEHLPGARFDIALHVEAGTRSTLRHIHLARRERETRAVRAGQSRETAKRAAETWLQRELDVWRRVQRQALRQSDVLPTETANEVIVIDGDRLERGLLLNG
jgi:hypothetical protein